MRGSSSRRRKGADSRLNQVQLGRVVRRPALVRSWSGKCLTRIYAHEHIPWGNAREKAHCYSEDVCLLNNKKTTTTTTRGRRRAAKKFGKKQPRKRWEKWWRRWMNMDGRMVRWRLLGKDGKGRGREGVLQNKQIDKQATTLLLLLCGQQCQRAKGPPHDL